MAGFRVARANSRLIASRMKSERLFSPAIASIRAATSAVSRIVVTTVSTFRLSGGLPIGRVVACKIIPVKSTSVPYSLIDLHNVCAYILNIKSAQEPQMTNEALDTGTKQTMPFVHFKANAISGAGVTVEQAQRFAARIAAAYDAGEAVWMVADELKLRVQMTAIKPHRSARDIAIRIVKAA